jgi:hypothetical protein
MAKIDLFEPDAYESISKDEECELLKGSERPRFIHFPEVDNFFTQYYRFMTLNRGPYPDYYAAGALNLLSVVADKRIYTPIEYGKMYSNIWTIQLGVSTLSHKTIAMRPTKLLAYEVMPNCSWPGQFSAVGLFQHVSERQHGYLFKDECGVMLRAMNTNNETKNARDFFCELYENDPIDSRVLAISQKKKAGEIQNVWLIDDPYGTISMATTPGTFQRATTEDDITSGYLYRFAYFNPNFVREVPPLDTMRSNFDTGFAEIKKNLIAIRDKVKDWQHTKMIMSSTGKEMWQAWQRKNTKALQADRDELKSTLFQRLVTLPLKLAMAYTIGSQDFLKTKIPGDYQMSDDHILIGINQTNDYFIRHGYDTLKLVGSGAMLNRIEKLEHILVLNGGVLTMREAYRSVGCSRKELIDIFDAGIELRETLKLIKVDGVEKVIYTPNPVSQKAMP